MHCLLILTKGQKISEQNCRAVSNSMHFDRFLGEIMAWNFFFKINWPLQPDWVYLFFSRLFLFDVYFIAAVLRTNGVIKWPTPHFLHCWCGNLSHNFLWWHRQMTTGVGFTPHYDPLFFTFIFVNHCTPPTLRRRQPVARAALSPPPPCRLCHYRWHCRLAKLGRGLMASSLSVTLERL